MARRSELPTIIIDTREQLPYAFTGYTVQRATLPTGDYSLLGYEHRIAIERKSREDAYGVVGSGRKRFTACLERLAALDQACIVIECSLAQFATPPERTLIDARMAVGSFISWMVAYRVPVIWCDSRAYAERIVIRFLAAYLKHVSNGRDYQPSPATRAHPSALSL